MAEGISKGMAGVADSEVGLVLAVCKASNLRGLKRMGRSRDVGLAVHDARQRAEAFKEDQLARYIYSGTPLRAGKMPHERRTVSEENAIAKRQRSALRDRIAI